MIGNKIQDASYKVQDSGLDLTYRRDNMVVHEAKTKRNKGGTTGYD